MTKSIAQCIKGIWYFLSYQCVNDSLTSSKALNSLKISMTCMSKNLQKISVFFLSLMNEIRQLSLKGHVLILLENHLPPFQI